jgi:hypothetical protein
MSPAAIEVVTGAVRFLLAMTAKEKLLQRAPHWSEEQAERALRAAECDEAIDEWGDLAKLHEVSSAEMMRRLANEAQAAGPRSVAHWITPPAADDPARLRPQCVPQD